MALDDLTRAIEEARAYGWVVCHWRARVTDAAPTEDELDAYMVESGVKALGDGDEHYPGGWSEIPIETARHVLAHHLVHTLSYGRPLDGSVTSAPELEPWFALFGPRARCFTNHRLGTGASTPKTGHTFDLGVVIIDGARIGVVWYADED